MRAMTAGTVGAGLGPATGGDAFGATDRGSRSDSNPKRESSDRDDNYGAGSRDTYRGAGGSDSNNDQSDSHFRKVGGRGWLRQQGRTNYKTSFQQTHSLLIKYKYHNGK